MNHLIYTNTTTDILLDHIYFGSTSDPIYETLRRCAIISYKIDNSFSQNVGGDNLLTLQTVFIGTRDEDHVISGESFSQIIEDDVCYIQIGESENSFEEAVIYHEHGHTLMFDLLEYKVQAGGGHYMDQKSRPSLAFLEGWADFWACFATNNSSLYSINPYNYGVDINTVEAQNFIYTKIKFYCL